LGLPITHVVGAKAITKHLAFLIHPNCRNERRMWRKAAI
jgi:hypothetical protein